MGALILPSRFMQQPQQTAAVDSSNPLTRGLTGALYPSMRGAQKVGGAGFQPSRNGIGFSTSSPSDAWIVSPTALASTSPTWTMLAILSGNVATTGAPGVTFYAERPNSTQIAKLELNTTSGTVSMVVRDLSGNLANPAGTTDIRTDIGMTRVLIGTRRASNQHLVFLNGKQEGSNSTNVSGSFGATNAVIGSDPQDSTTYLAGASVPLVLVWNRALSDAEIAEISRNPWQVFKAPARRLWIATTSGAGAALAGSANGQSAATGVLGTSILLTAGAAATAAAVGALSTSISLAATPTVISSAAGALTTMIRLAGAANAQPSAAGSLATAIALTGSASVGAAASGTLAGTGVQFSGAAIAAASASGSLTTMIALTGSGQSIATASGVFAGGAAQLSGTAGASATAAGQVTTLINLNGAATSTAAATATFSGSGAQLSGAATAAAGTSGALTTAIALAGAAIAQASASAALVGQSVALVGSASARASVSGVLLTGIGLVAAARAVSSGQAALTTQIAMVAIAQAQATAASELSTRSQIDVSMIPPSHIVSFASRSRVVTFRGKSRIVRF